MCGISGAYWFPHATSRRPPPIEALRHRGPDGFARYRSTDARCDLALARLAIVRPDAPASVARHGALVSVTTGEIYDYEELARRLAHPVTVDTELVPPLWQTYGSQLLKHIRGPLVAAIYDEGKQELVVLRDAVGKRPLYFARFADGVLFASEMKAILAVRPLTPRRAYIAHALTFGCVDPSVTPYEEIELLPPGAMLTVNDNGASVLQIDQLQHTATSTFDDLRHALVEAAALRIPRDVPSAVAVGGMDSLIVNALAELPSFTIDRDAKETANAQHALQRLQRSPTQTSPMEAPSRLALRQGLWLVESVDAAASWHMAPATLAFGHAVRSSGIKVLMTGEGADEAFIGYPWQLHHAIPEAVMTRGTPVIFDAEAKDWVGRLRPMLQWRIIADPVAIAYSDVITRLTSHAPLTLSLPNAGDLQLDSLRHDMHMLPVVHNDRLFFAAHIETRMPFLDRRVLDAALGLDASHFDAQRKPVVRRIFESLYGYEPPAKMGFTGNSSPEQLFEAPRNVLDSGILEALVPTRLTASLLWRAFLVEELYAVMSAPSLADVEAP